MSLIAVTTSATMAKKNANALSAHNICKNILLLMFDTIVSASLGVFHSVTIVLNIHTDPKKSNAPAITIPIFLRLLFTFDSSEPKINS
jgi:hypothetical protein